MRNCVRCGMRCPKSSNTHHQFDPLQAREAENARADFYFSLLAVMDIARDSLKEAWSERDVAGPETSNLTYVFHRIDLGRPEVDFGSPDGDFGIPSTSLGSPDHVAWNPEPRTRNRPTPRWVDDPTSLGARIAELVSRDSGARSAERPPTSRHCVDPDSPIARPRTQAQRAPTPRASTEADRAACWVSPRATLDRALGLWPNAGHRAGFRRLPAATGPSPSRPGVPPRSLRKATATHPSICAYPPAHRPITIGTRTRWRQGSARNLSSWRESAPAAAM